MLTNKADAFFRLLAYDDLFRVFQHCTQQGADTRRAGSDDENGIVGRNFRDTCRPESGGKNIAYEKCLFIGYTIRNTVQPLIGIRHPYIFRLSAVDAAAQGPASVFVFAVVYISMLAEKAFATKSFHVNRHTVAGLHGGDLLAYLFYNAYHLMPYGNARHGTRDTSMLDMQIAGTDTSQRDAHHGITGAFQFRHGFFYQRKMSVLHIGIC